MRIRPTNTKSLAGEVMACMFFGSVLSANALTVSLSPETSNGVVGDTVSFDIMIDFSGDDTLGGLLDITFDESVLTFVAYTDVRDDAGAYLGDPDLSRSPDLLPGRLNGIAGGDFDGLGEARVGTVVFEIVGSTPTTTNIGIEPAQGFGPFVSSITFGPHLALVDFNGASLTTTTDIDSDGDGVADSVDNCTFVANPAQRDTNGDGFGNLCDADLNGDCIVNAIDLGAFKSVFFSSDANADFNGDGIVNAVDLGIFRSQFFSQPGPSAFDSLCTP